MSKSGSCYLDIVSTLDEIVRTLGSANDLVLPDDPSGLRAAVAVVLRQGIRESEILFIQRAERAGDPWSGHMAFPGGRRQTTDVSLLQTATRETLEEIGLDLATHGYPVTRLPDVMPYSKMPEPITVSAFVFVLERPTSLELNDEVALAVWAPLEEVLRGDHATGFRWRREGFDVELPALEVHGRVVWGLTYRMIELLRSAAAHGIVPPTPLRR